MIIPDWNIPTNIKAVSSTREGGYSLPPYGGLNLGLHVGDDSQTVEQNRHHLMQMAGMSSAPVWLNQTHSTRVVQLREPTSKVPDADGAFTDKPGIVCAVMTADCVPILLANKNGQEVAAVHAGWRGLADGILENALTRFHGDVMAWVGPCIGKDAFEVGEDVVNAFVCHEPQARIAFEPREQDGKWRGDLCCLVQQRLSSCGVSDITFSQLCTYMDSERFFSYRRDGVTGRQASCIWINEC